MAGAHSGISQTNFFVAQKCCAAVTFFDWIPSVRFITEHVLQLVFVVLFVDGFLLSVTESNLNISLHLLPANDILTLILLTWRIR